MSRRYIGGLRARKFLLAFFLLLTGLCIAILSFLRSRFRFLGECICHEIEQCFVKNHLRQVCCFVNNTSNTPSPGSRMDTSDVPPPDPYTSILCCPSSFSRPYASAAASRLVYYTLDIRSAISRILCGLFLAVGEICENWLFALCYRFSEI